uniref:DUF4005 domain-containing protein n=1 Tax=Zea mays TaxID=4577 RepID=A0A804MYE2_MAIZE
MLGPASLHFEFQNPQRLLPAQCPPTRSHSKGSKAKAGARATRTSVSSLARSPLFLPKPAAAWGVACLLPAPLPAPVSLPPTASGNKSGCRRRRSVREEGGTERDGRVREVGQVADRAQEAAREGRLQGQAAAPISPRRRIARQGPQVEAVADLLRRPGLHVARLQRRQPALGGVGGLGRRVLGGRRPRRPVHGRRRHRRPRPGQGLHGRPPGVGRHPRPDRVPRVLGSAGAPGAQGAGAAPGDRARAAGAEAGGRDAAVHAGAGAGAGAHPGAPRAHVHRGPGRAEAARGAPHPDGYPQGSRGLNCLLLFYKMILAWFSNASGRRRTDPHCCCNLSLSQEGWCDSQGTLEQVRVKLQKRQEGAIKRERAIAYAYSQQADGAAKCNPPKLTSNGLVNHSGMLLKHQNLDKGNGNWSWLERWMAARPWENRLMEEHNSSSPDFRSSKNCEDSFGVLGDFSEPNSVKVRKNNVSKRVCAKPPGPTHAHGHHQRLKAQSISSLSTELHNDESSASSSSCFASTPISFTLVASEKTEDSVRTRPNYMSMTESIKAKQKACSAQRTVALKQCDDRKAMSAELKVAQV